MTSRHTDILPEDWHKWSRIRPTVAGPLTSGLTNRSFLLAAENITLVLRWNSPISAELDLDRHMEEQALRRAGQAGLGAPVVYCDPDHRYLVTRFIDGSPWRDLSGNSKPALAQLARLTQNIHQLPTVDRTLDIPGKISHYWQSIRGSEEFIRALRTQDREVRAHAAAAARMNDGMVLCHNDLQPENLIFGKDGVLYAIDWEYAASGDPFYDLAVISEEHQLQGSDLQRFLDTYLLRPATSADLQRLTHWRVIYIYLSLLWYAVQRCQRSAQDRALDTKISALQQRLARVAGV